MSRNNSRMFMFVFTLVITQSLEVSKRKKNKKNFEIILECPASGNYFHKIVDALPLVLLKQGMYWYFK